MVTAKKYGRNGTQYTGHGTTVRFWPAGNRYASIRYDAINGYCRRAFHKNRAEAVFYVGEWIDPEQDGRNIIDNDAQLICPPQVS